jgi:excisionase family DNA binding protein
VVVGVSASLNDSADLARYLAQPDLIGTLDRTDLAALLSRLKALEGAVLARLLITPPAATGDHPAQDDARLLTVDEVAARTRFARSYVYELLRKHELRGVKTGKYWRVTAASLDEWIVRHQPFDRTKPSA